MTAPYQGIVSQLRTAFPAPVSDEHHVHAVLEPIWKARKEVEWP